jgi:hypothetical protein
MNEYRKVVWFGKLLLLFLILILMLKLASRISQARVIDTHKSLWKAIDYPNQKLEPFEPNFLELKQLLLQPWTVRTRDMGHAQEIQLFCGEETIDIQDPWTYYLCTRHDDKQLSMLPRSMFTVLFHYISNACVTPATSQDHVLSVLRDMKSLKYEWTQVEQRLILLTFQKCSAIAVPSNMIDYVSRWPVSDTQKVSFYLLLCRRYQQLGSEEECSTVFGYMLEKGLHAKSPDPMVEFCLGLDGDRDLTLHRLLHALVEHDIPIDPLLYSRVLDKTCKSFDNIRMTEYMLKMYISQQMQDPVHFQALLEQCKRNKLYKEAHLLWCYGSSFKCPIRRLHRVFLPVQTCMLYCDILLSQKREAEASLIIRNMLAFLPLPNRKGRPLRHSPFFDIHGEFLLLCLKHACYSLFQQYLELIQDTQLPLSVELKKEITLRMHEISKSELVAHSSPLGYELDE